MTLSRQFKLATHRGQNARLIPALMGRDDGGASYTSTVPGGLGLVYVRIWQGDSICLTTALNPYSVSTTGDTAIWLDVDQSGRLLVLKERYTG